eukprot:m.16277 g.16277  ORF g.16277 m.16277 type:complete len:356 (+) comp10970_c0_seq1:199-1266(+)
MKKKKAIISKFNYQVPTQYKKKAVYLFFAMSNQTLTTAAATPDQVDDDDSTVLSDELASIQLQGDAIKQKAWVHDDIKIRTSVERGTNISTTGGFVWEAARTLLRFLECECASIGLDQTNATILELGAGTGFLGMSVAKNLPSCAVVMITEMEQGGALEHLEFNVSLNPTIPRVATAPLDWSIYGQQTTITNEQRTPDRESTSTTGVVADENSDAIVADVDASVADENTDVSVAALYTQNKVQAATLVPNPIDAKKWDFIIGSDLVYNEDGVDMLPRVFDHLLTDDNVAYYCHTKHRYDDMDFDFLNTLKARGLVVEEVRCKGDRTPSPSPILFEFLFNEHRIVVYKITREQQSQ